MKIGRYLNGQGQECLGVVVSDPASAGSEAAARDRLGKGVVDYRVLDLAAAGSACGKASLPGTMDGFIDAGAAALELAYEVLEWAVRQADPRWFTSEAATRWLPPVEVRTCFAAGRNFGKHKAETADYWKQQAAGFNNEIPMGFVKLARTVVATNAEVARPVESTWFDYEVEPAAVIGSRVNRISERDALTAVFGYTVFNDLSARDLQRKEMANQTILVGKNLPGFGPLGPWILTADEVPDPAMLELELRVNGQVRQNGRCSDMINSFAQLISSWSAMGLVRGDVIAGGTPEGVAVGRPDPQNFYLRPGDLVEAEIRQIGVLTTRIV